MKINPTFQEGEKVYVKTHVDQKPFMIIGYDVRGDKIRYILRIDLEEVIFFDYELSREIDTVLKTSY